MSLAPGSPVARLGAGVSALVRSTHPEPAVAVVAVTAALAVSAGRDLVGVAATIAAVAAGQLSVGWCNDAVDADRDRANDRRDKPVAAGEISGPAVWRAALIALAASVPLSLLSGWRATVAHTVAVLAAWSYNLGLKATVFSVVPYTLAFGLLPTFVTLGLPGAPGPPWWAPLAGGVLGAGAHFANVLPDIDDDLATGVRGLPQRMEAGASRVAAAALLVAASALLVLGPGRLGSPGEPASAAFTTAGLTVVLVVLVAGLVLGRRLGSRAAFRVTLLLAAVDVLLLLARGGALA